MANHWVTERAVYSSPPLIACSTLCPPPFRLASTCWNPRLAPDLSSTFSTSTTNHFEAAVAISGPGPRVSVSFTVCSALVVVLVSSFFYTRPTRLPSRSCQLSALLPSLPVVVSQALSPASSWLISCFSAKTHGPSPGQLSFVAPI